MLPCLKFAKNVIAWDVCFWQVPMQVFPWLTVPEARQDREKKAIVLPHVPPHF